MADYYGLDLSSVTRAFYEQMVNTRRIPLTFAPEATEALKRLHSMHRLSGSWAGRSECHVANSGDWLVGLTSNAGL